MDGVLFLASLVAIGLVMWWVVYVDRAGRGDTADTGMFAMREPPKPRQSARDRTA